jgi:hypothetical protein
LRQEMIKNAILFRDIMNVHWIYFLFSG